MDKYTKEELQAAIRAITSTINKSEKARLKLKAGTWQHTMTVQAIKANYIVIALLNRELESNAAGGPFKSAYTEEELDNALEAVTTIISRVEKIQPKFEEGTPQHTLAIRRIKALNISLALIKRELDLDK
jgi:molybdopterin-binding protein